MTADETKQAETQIKVEFLHLIAENFQPPTVEQVDEILDMHVDRVINRLNYALDLIEYRDWLKSQGL